MACLPKVEFEMILSGLGFKQNLEVAKDYLGYKLAFHAGFRLDHRAQTCYYNKYLLGLTYKWLSLSQSMNI